jgi:hypothetical protein
MTRKEALAAGEMFFTGRVCKKHKELRGKRRSKNYGCPACLRERTQKRRKKASKAWHKSKSVYQRKRLDAIKAGTWSPRPYRKQKATDAIARADG